MIVTLAIASCEEHLSECNYDLDPTSRQDCEKLKKCCEEIIPTGKEPTTFTDTVGNKKLGNITVKVLLSVKLYHLEKMIGMKSSIENGIVLQF